MIYNHQKYGKNYRYSQENEPLFQGIKYDYVNEADYIVGGVHFLPGFTSTSKLKTVAKHFARQG